SWIGAAGPRGGRPDCGKVLGEYRWPRAEMPRRDGRGYWFRAISAGAKARHGSRDSPGRGTEAVTPGEFAWQGLSER
ncbi:hypothetical protein ACOTEO_20760, partial [Achromobacter xylosoxidans]